MFCGSMFEFVIEEIILKIEAPFLLLLAPRRVSGDVQGDLEASPTSENWLCITETLLAQY